MLLRSSKKWNSSRIRTPFEARRARSWKIFSKPKSGLTPLPARKSKAVMDALTQLEEVEFIEDPNTIRGEARKILEDLFKAEERIDASARQKIESQKRIISEGTQEWDILYRKYYNEEVKKLGI